MPNLLVVDSRNQNLKGKVFTLKLFPEDCARFRIWAYPEPDDGLHGNFEIIVVHFDSSVNLRDERKREIAMSGKDIRRLIKFKKAIPVC